MNVKCVEYKNDASNLNICSLCEHGGTYAHYSLAPAVTEGATEGAMESASVWYFTSSFAYNFKKSTLVT